MNGVGNTFIEGLFVLGMPDKKLASNVEKIFALVAGDELLTVSYFHLACTLGLFNLIKSTLDNVANNPELKNSYLCSLNDLGQTPLHSVILLNMTKDTSQIVELLLKNGADVHVKDFELQTPLHCAQVDLDPEISYLLVNHGANIPNLWIIGYLVRCQFDNGEIRQPLLVESRKSLNLIFCPLLPAQYVDTILDYLSNEDLENIIKSR
ncbi:hypothetical protein QAD02_011297 [Eretmocerus hayati]|uniref:Uncharacterized protein n=1 Tax=Eretmocerus hayati TaxID=131215 RepID=A0ACC2NXI7_9HYME|nr:hypothetical protein QAD02_011297 [Eretmocerus hayati]